MVPTLSLPGCAREALMKSWSVLNSESAPVAKTRSNADGRDCGEILHRIERKRLVDGRAYRCAVRDETDRVTVGYLREHRARRRNAAWSRLILHNRCPSLSPSFSAATRAVMSATPAAANGRTKRTGRLG